MGKPQHPTTGAAQLVEIREQVIEIPVPTYVPAAAPERLEPELFARLGDDELLAYGVPPEWLADVRAADEDRLLEIAGHLPAEAAEALLELATGGTPALPEVAAEGADPFQHPDAQRRFRVMGDVEELERALEFPWDKWTVFLHPAQRQLVERDYAGPARVSGSAGTGKTVVALHRAVHLAEKNEGARILLSTFSPTLANALRGQLFRLVSNRPKLAERIEVEALDAVAERLFASQSGKPALASAEAVHALIDAAAARLEGLRLAASYLHSEWADIVDARQLDSWEAYRDIRRLGRRTRLSEAQRMQLWQVFDEIRGKLAESGLRTQAGLYAELARSLPTRRHPPYDFIVLDEAQDVSVPQLRFLAALGADRPNALFFAGDLGQRIFQQPFSWKSLGVDIRGRSRSLRINYRTSHQIRRQADRLLGGEVSDVDGNVESRRGTISVFNGPEPEVCLHASATEESVAVGAWLKAHAEAGVAPQEMGVFVRSRAELPRAVAAVEAAGLAPHQLDERMAGAEGCVNVGTMHRAKGLEFRVAAVMACDDEVIPAAGRIDAVADEAELAEVYDTERHLLYVACTRARDALRVSGVRPGSEFLEDLQQKEKPARR